MIQQWSRVRWRISSRAARCRQRVLMRHTLPSQNELSSRMAPARAGRRAARREGRSGRRLAAGSRHP
eukprot:3040794-Prymnesium_polylepis.1